jgi:hypothetical protein
MAVPGRDPRSELSIPSAVPQSWPGLGLCRRAPRGSLLLFVEGAFSPEGEMDYGIADVDVRVIYGTATL